MGAPSSSVEGMTSRRPLAPLSSLRLLVIDDHPLFRAGLRHLVNELADQMEVVEAGDVDQGREVLAGDAAIDLALIDLLMPGMTGFESLRRFCHEFHQLPVVVVSVKERSEEVRLAIDAGAKGYIPKSSNPEVLLNALKLVISGGVYLPPNLLNLSEPRSDWRPEIRRQTIPPHGSLARLTVRQREVLTLLAEGKSNKEIAQDLGLAAGTVKIHVSSIFKALNVNNRTLAVIAANELMAG